VPSGEQVAVPAQDGPGTYEQPDAAEDIAGELVQQRGEEHPIGLRELHLLAVQLPLEHGELVAEGEDLRIFGLITHRQQPQHRQRVGHLEVRQSQEHSGASSRSCRQRSVAAWNVDRGKIPS
jgi:hypothetical protein